MNRRLRRVLSGGSVLMKQATPYRATLIVPHVAMIAPSAPVGLSSYFLQGGSIIR